MPVSERAQEGEDCRERRRRRTWSSEEKRRIVAETEAPGSSVSVVARRHDLNANLLFTWRRALGPQRVTGGAAVTFVPAVMTAEEPALSQPAAADRERTVGMADGSASSPGGRMEIVLAGGCRVIVDKHVSAPALARVIGVLMRR
jgi:transposase